jgi:hypothetical protein
MSPITDLTRIPFAWITLYSALLAWTVTVVPSIAAQSTSREIFKEGVDYTRLETPVKPKVAPGKIEVAEFIIYTYPGMYEARPVLDQ